VREGAAIDRGRAFNLAGGAVARVAGQVAQTMTGGGRIGLAREGILRRVGLLRERRGGADSDSAGEEQPSGTLHAAQATTVRSGRATASADRRRPCAYPPPAAAVQPDRAS